MDFIEHLIPRHERSTKCESRMDYRCDHCGFAGVARAIGRGSASRTVYTDESYVEAEAYAQAAEEATALLSLLVCPQCGKRNKEHWARFQHQTRITQGAVAAVCLTIIVLSMRQNPQNPGAGVFLLIVGAILVFFIGYSRNLRAYAAEKRVTFLSPDELAAEAEQAAKEAAEREEARRARPQQRAPKKKRSRFK